MKNQAQIAATPDPASVPPAPGNTSSLISITTDRFPVWISRHPARWIVSVAVVITLVTLLCLGWIEYTVQPSLIQSSGHRLVQAATDAAHKLDIMILERCHDIQLLSTTPMAQGQNPEALTTFSTNWRTPTRPIDGLASPIHVEQSLRQQIRRAPPPIRAGVSGFNRHAPSLASGFCVRR
jgi:hypothetical protein